MTFTPQNARILQGNFGNQKKEEGANQTKANAGDGGNAAGINGENAAGIEMAAQRVRRMAPEFVLNVSNEAWEIVKDLPEHGIRAVKAEAYARIYTAEEKLCGRVQYVTIGSMIPMLRVTKWWHPFQVEDVASLKHQWFQLDYKDTSIREYKLVLTEAPQPGDDPPEPKMTRQQALAEEKKKNQKKNGRGPKGGAKAVIGRPRAGAKKNGVKHQFKILYRLLRRDVHHNLKQLFAFAQRLPFEHSPRFTSSIAGMKLVCGNAISEGARMYWARKFQVESQLRDLKSQYERASELFEQHRRDFAEAFNDRYNLLIGSREVLVQEVRHRGRLAPRCVAQNTGLRIDFYSWDFEEPPPVDWSQYPFGVKIDWNADLFGPPEDGRQAFG